jgi:hypothetical protein
MTFLAHHRSVDVDNFAVCVNIHSAPRKGDGVHDLQTLTGLLPDDDRLQIIAGLSTVLVPYASEFGQPQ